MSESFQQDLLDHIKWLTTRIAGYENVLKKYADETHWTNKESIAATYYKDFGFSDAKDILKTNGVLR